MLFRIIYVTIKAYTKTRILEHLFRGGPQMSKQANSESKKILKIRKYLGN